VVEPHNLIERIESRMARIVVWGAGQIGLSSALSLAASGFSCTAVDINRELVEKLNQGEVPFAHHGDWVGLPIASFMAAGRFRACTELAEADAAEADIHLVCVNTDAAERPHAAQIHAVLRQIASLLDGRRERMVSVESTIVPAWVEEDIAALPVLVGEHTHLVAAPRRDWFLRDELDLRTVARVVGTHRPSSREVARRFYATISDDVVLASDWRHAALSKIVENTLRFVDIVLTNQLNLALPDHDVAEIMRLAATKWNVPSYHPSFGIGGYCVPLAPLYLSCEVANDSELPLLRAAMEADARYADRLAERLQLEGPELVGILGLSYASNSTIYARSPGVRLAQSLASRGVQVIVHDPYLTPEEVRERYDLSWLAYPDDLSLCSLLLVATPHDAYRDLRERLHELCPHLPVIDNLGEFRQVLDDETIEYREMGTPLLDLHVRPGDVAAGDAGR